MNMTDLEKQFETNLHEAYNSSKKDCIDYMYDYENAWDDEAKQAKEKFLEKWDQIEDLEQIEYDSYGSEDSTLGYVFQDKESERYIKVLGKRQSYVGKEWDSIQEVRPQQKIITVYETFISNNVN